MDFQEFCIKILEIKDGFRELSDFQRLEYLRELESSGLDEGFKAALIAYLRKIA